MIYFWRVNVQSGVLHSQDVGELVLQCEIRSFVVSPANGHGAPQEEHGSPIPANLGCRLASTSKKASRSSGVVLHSVHTLSNTVQRQRKHKDSHGTPATLVVNKIALDVFTLVFEKQNPQS